MSVAREAALRKIFTKYDRDRNGRIDTKELRDIFREMGKVFSDQKVINCYSTLF